MTRVSGIAARLVPLVCDAVDVLPALRERDVTDDQITTMLVDNPRRYFETVK